MNSSQHSRDQVAAEIVGFPGHFGIEDGQGGSVRQKSHEDSVLGSTLYNPHQMLSKGKNNHWQILQQPIRIKKKQQGCKRAMEKFIELSFALLLHWS